MPKGRTKAVKASAAERRRVALAALFHAEEYWREYSARTGGGLWSFTVDNEGEMRVEYNGTLVNGLGKIACSYYPLPAIERAAAEIEERFDRITLRETPGAPVTDLCGERLQDHVPPSERNKTLAALTRFFAITFTGHLGPCFLDAIKGAFDDTAAFAEMGLHDCLQGIYAAHGAQLEKPDVKALTKSLVDDAGRRRRERLGPLIEVWRRIAPRGKGRPPFGGTPAVAAMLRTHGKVTLEAAAEWLDCGVQTLKDWAASTEWKTWTRARAALLDELKRPVKPTKKRTENKS